MAMADEFSSTIIIDAKRAAEVERLGRNMVVSMGGSASICLYPMRGRDAKRSLVRGTLTLALWSCRAHDSGVASLGRRSIRASARLSAQHAVLQPMSEWYSAARSRTLLRQTQAGWATGRLVIEGTGD